MKILTGCQNFIVNLDTANSSPTFSGILGPGMIHQHPAYHLSGNTKEMSPPFPLHPILIHQGEGPAVPELGYSLATPALRRPLATKSLWKAADSVRNDWAATRIRAMRTGGLRRGRSTFRFGTA